MSAVDNAVPTDGATQSDPSSSTGDDGTASGDDGNVTTDTGGFVPDDSAPSGGGRDAQSATPTMPKPAVDAAVQRDAGPSVRDAGPPKQPLDAESPSAPPTLDAQVDVPDSAPEPPPPPPPPTVPTCSAGTQLCGSACVDVQTDPVNCGTCGTSCGDNTCVAAVCTQPTPPPPPATNTPDGCTAQAYGGHSYLFCTTGLNWINARDACRKVAMMDMTVINDAAENDFVKGAGQTWVGASDIDGEAKWRALKPGVASRTSGPLVGYTNWTPGQPDNVVRCSGTVVLTNDCYLLGDVRTDEDCAVMQADGRWEDVQCQLKSHNYVCESY